MMKGNLLAIWFDLTGGLDVQLMSVVILFSYRDRWYEATHYNKPPSPRPYHMKTILVQWQYIRVDDVKLTQAIVAFTLTRHLEKRFG